ncbi:MarR family winged helix-turn-helix transcriptional regulator [Lentzea albidocapillata]|uniref:DNA-binding transcriptional regulator, MarR family n=1 Tax=Lentzea albidocapillata TaxID=40571 RepID=A0A1W2DGF8_9PSEU|nr:MarR family transcriptional regulator [Lentzea albidocapillata]SMC96640.1 DNA-binding transcriptional regulator, MarR family [Lentzea albidocapillata]
MADLRLVFSDLVRFQIELWGAVETRLRAECDLQLTWFEVMRLLDERAGCRVQDLAEEFGITVGGTSKVVDRVEAAGYCRRRANPDDRRSSIVELTASGRRVVAKAAKVFDDELEIRVGSVLPERSLKQLAKTLADLRAAYRASA